MFPFSIVLFSMFCSIDNVSFFYSLFLVYQDTVLFWGGILIKYNTKELYRSKDLREISPNKKIKRIFLSVSFKKHQLCGELSNYVKNAVLIYFLTVFTMLSSQKHQSNYAAWDDQAHSYHCCHSVPHLMLHTFYITCMCTHVPKYFC